MVTNSGILVFVDTVLRPLKENSRGFLDIPGNLMNIYLLKCLKIFPVLKRVTKSGCFTLYFSEMYLRCVVHIFTKTLFRDHCASNRASAAPKPRSGPGFHSPQGRTSTAPKPEFHSPQKLGFCGPEYKNSKNVINAINLL